MEQYINKSEVVSEIKRYKHKADERLKIKGRTLAEDCKDSALQNLCGNLLYFLDNIETKEVDLEKEIKNYLDEQPIVARSQGIDYKLVPSPETIAKHFFELGLKAQKGK